MFFLFDQAKIICCFENHGQRTVIFPTRVHSLIMNLHSLCLPTIVSMSSFNPKATTNEDTHNSRKIPKQVNSGAPNKLITKFLLPDSPEPATKPCLCGRRHFIGAASLGTTRFPIQPARATNSDSDDYTVIPSLLYQKN